MAMPFDIVAYTYKADTYCPECIIEQLPTGPGEDFDGWALAEGADPMTTEANLNEIAAAFGINRGTEHTFDSSYFPKVSFRDQTMTTECGRCGRVIA